MKWPIIVHLEKQWSSAFDPDYCDETSELKISSDMKRAAKEGREYVPKPWQSYDYLNKEDVGAVKVQGFLFRTVATGKDGVFTHPDLLSGDEKKDRLRQAWGEHARKFPALEKSHIRLVVSMSNEFHDSLVKSGLSPDQAIQSIVNNSMSNFRDKFFPGDQLGYIYGAHHDTDNLHVHVFVHPRSRDGKQVSFSSQLARRQADPSRADHLGFFKGCVERQVKQWQKRVESPEERKNLGRHLRSDRILYAPSLAGVSRLPGNDLEFAALKHQKQRLERLDREIADARAGLRRSQRNLALRLMGIRTNVWVRLAGEIVREVTVRKIRALQAQRNELRRFYVASLHKRRRSPTSPTRVFARETVKPKVAPSTPGASQGLAVPRSVRTGTRQFFKPALKSTPKKTT